MMHEDVPDVRVILAELRAGDGEPTFERVPWHLFGYEDLPDLLRRLRGGDAGDVNAALGALWDRVSHQGGMYAGAALVVPFLLRAAADPDVHGRAVMLRLAAEAGRRNHFGTDVRGDLLEAAVTGLVIDGSGYHANLTNEAARRAIGADGAIVVGMLDDPAPAVRCNAAYALAAALPPARSFGEALRARSAAETDPAARVSMLLARAQLAREAGDPDAARWTRDLWSDPSQPADVRTGAAVGWLCVTDAPAPEPLLDLLADAAPQVADAMKGVPWPDRIGRLGAWFTALLDEPVAQRGMIRRLAASPDAESRASACTGAYVQVSTWRSATPGMVALLGDRLADPDAGVRASATRCLARTGGAAGVVADRLADRVHDEDPEIGAWAVAGLARCGDRRAVAPLAGLLGGPWPKSDRRSAGPVRLIDRLSAHAAELLPAVRRRLRDMSPRDGINRDLVQGLGAWGPAAADAVPELIACLDAWPDATMVATTLGRIGTGAAEAVPALRRLADEDAAVPVWACWRITGADADAAAATLARLVAAPPHRARTLRLLADLGSAARPHADMIRALPSGRAHTWLPTEAAHALWCCTGEPGEALPVLLGCLDRVEKEPWRLLPVQARAMEYLGRIGPAADAAIPALEAFLNGDRRVGISWHDDRVSTDEHFQDVAATALERIRPSG